nr:hypothetical protein [uncultured Allomuricauda sp.]
MSCAYPNFNRTRNITSHSQLNDGEFKELFKTTALSPQLFTHEAHLRLAWIHINLYEEEVAIEKICKQIKDFDEIHGTGDKFHHTITVSSIKIMRHFILKSKSNRFEDFLLEFPRLLTSFKELLLKHYSADLIFSKKAKTGFVPPDLLPFG